MGRPLELHRCAWRLGLWDCADIEDMFVVWLLLILMAIDVFDIFQRREVSYRKRNMSNQPTKHSSPETITENKTENCVSKNKPQLSEDIKIMLESLNKNFACPALISPSQKN